MEHVGPPSNRGFTVANEPENYKGRFALFKGKPALSKR